MRRAALISAPTRPTFQVMTPRPFRLYWLSFGLPAGQDGGMNNHRIFACGVLAMALGLSDLSAGASEITYRVGKDVLHRVDPRVFGQFMERPSWGEIGPEGALVTGTNRLQPEVFRLPQQMQIPVLRFPGGTDVDFLDCREMVSNVPGRGEQRPVSTGHKGHKVTNRFGYDEFMQFSESVKAEPILVVNLRDGLLKKRPMGEYVQHVAGLVAYCNAPIGAKLPGHARLAGGAGQDPPPSRIA